MAQKDPLNQLQYLKKQYETAGDNKGLQKWANSQAQNYYSQLDPGVAKQVQGMNASQLGDYRNSLNQPKTTSQPTTNPSPTAQVNFDQYRTQSATIDDIANKYGFDFSRDYAKRQSEAEAQAKRDAANQGKRAVDSNVESAAEGLDRNYFQRYMQQQQAQTNSGLNGGIAADQDLRMAMSRQAELGDVYRDANLEKMRLEDALGRVELERLAREDSMYNDRLMQGAGLAMQTDQLRQQENLSFLNNALQQRGQNIGMDQFDRSMENSDYWKQIGQNNWETQFDNENQWRQTEFDANEFWRNIGQENTVWDRNNLTEYQRRSLANQASGGSGGLTPWQQIQLMEEYGMLDFLNGQASNNATANQRQKESVLANPGPIDYLLPKKNEPKKPTFTGGPLDYYLR